MSRSAARMIGPARPRLFAVPVGVASLACAVVLGGTLGCESQRVGVCHDECDVTGARRCDGSVVLSCGLDEDGCRSWSANRDCASNGEVCEQTEQDARCVSACTAACSTESDARCNGDVVERCELGADGCLAWSHVRDCGAADGQCEEDSTGVRCVGTCTSTCYGGTAEQVCVDAVIYGCVRLDNGCYVPELVRDCGESGQICQEWGMIAWCMSPCSSPCPAEGDTRCNGTVVQSCVSSPDGCLQWELVIDCADDGLACDDTDDATCL